MRRSYDASGCVDYTRPFKKVMGDWVTPPSIIFNNGPAVLASSWPGITLGLIGGGTPMRTIQLVRIAPVSQSSTPSIGRVRIDEIDCTFHDFADIQVCYSGETNVPAVNSAGVISDPGSTFVLNPTTGGITGTPTTVAWTATTGVAGSGGFTLPSTTPFSFNTPAYVTTTNSCSPEVKSICIGVSLYVAQYNHLTDIWDVRDPLLETTANRDDLLDLQTDMFLRPLPGFGFTGRKWTLSLPHPVIIGQGQALHATFSTAPFNSQFVELTTFVRSRITVIN